jgi:hypothetical protein
MSTKEQQWMKELDWSEATALTIGGLGWPEAERLQPFDRLPAALQNQIPEDTWWLAQQSAGVFVEFHTAARHLAVRWQMAPVEDQQRDRYMPPSGHSGMDLYGRDNSGEWQWIGTSAPEEEPEAAARLTKLPLDGNGRDYRLYLPLLRQCRTVEIGADAPVTPAAPDPRPPIVYYGTSIVHGAGVSRPGCGHAQRLAMALDCPSLNLGFCGRAFCEPALAEWIARQPARMLLIDPLPNNSAELLPERLPPFLEILAKGHPRTPTLLIEERLYADAAFFPERGLTCTAKNRALHEVVRQRRAMGQKNLHLIPMPGYYGPEGSTDANHPNDLGADRLFQQLLPAIRARL